MFVYLFVQQFFRGAALWSKLRLVHKPRLFQLGFRRIFFTCQTRGIPLRRFLIVEPLRFQGGGLGRCLQSLHESNQPEGGTVRKTDQIEAVLRILPLCEDLLLIAVVSWRNVGRSRGLCSRSVRRRDSVNEVVNRQSLVWYRS